MADCHDLFLDFHTKIKLTKSKTESLKQARDGIRSRIEKYFRSELKASIPSFKMQGSFAMKTTLNPLSGEYDVDDGVYLTNLPDSKDEWPSPATVHKWIYDAVDGHTNEKPTDKRTCVRVTYSGNYHVDLPIYGTYESETYLAEKGDKGWNKSDPIAFKDWFISKIKDDNEQLRRIVRYFKAWADYDSRLGKMPSSIILTVLASEAYLQIVNDDSCFSNVIVNVSNRIESNFQVLNPADSTEDLADRLSANQKDHFKIRIKSLKADSIEALQEDDNKEACKIWKKYFGDRFPNCENIKQESDVLITSAPAILKDDARSA